MLRKELPHVYSKERSSMIDGKTNTIMVPGSCILCLVVIIETSQHEWAHARPIYVSKEATAKPINEEF